MFNLKHIDTIYLPPTKTRSGNAKRPNDKKEIYKADNHNFKTPTIMMSDMHSHTQAAIDYLKDNYDLSRFIVITVGDMAGDLVFGSNGIPTGFYKQLVNHADSFYFVQGNHDLPDENLECDNLTNKDGQKCMVHSKIAKTTLGKIGGVNGTINIRTKDHPYKQGENDYINKLSKYKSRKIDILLLHDTPKHSSNVIGNEKIWGSIKQIKPKICIYGHCHHKSPYYYRDGVNLFNVDGRIIIFDIN